MTSYDSDSEDILENTPPNIKEAAEEATLDLLPVKSRQKYEQQYAHFMEWTNRNRTNRISENTLLAYFAEKNKVLKPSTLWSHYSMLRSTLAIKNNIQINRYPKLISFLKQKSVGFKPKKSKTWYKSEMDLFILEAPNDKFLMMKVALIIGVAGACRCDELCKMSINHVKDKDSIIIVTIPDSKTKRQRVLTITDGTTKNLHLYRTYVSLRPLEITHHRLFLTYRSNKCTVQPVGINTFSKMSSLIVNYLNLTDPNLYTGHCFRRTSATILVAQGGDIISLKKHGDWRSTSVAEGYVDNDISSKVQIAKKILGENKPTTSSTFGDVDNAIRDEIVTSNAIPSNLTFQETNKNRIINPTSGIINFGGVTNCTINIYHKGS